jgi:hypothetical protein
MFFRAYVHNWNRNITIYIADFGFVTSRSVNYTWQIDRSYISHYLEE